MKMIATTALFLSLAAMSFAASWTGKLIDANCADRGNSAPKAEPAQPAQPGAPSAQSCMPTQSTSSFALQTSDGKILKLDAAGNTKASAVARTDSAGNVQVSGELEGETVKVESISPVSSQNKGGPAPNQQK
jgi:hypothetical protein